MQSLAAFDIIFWVFSIIAFIIYIWERIGKSTRSGEQQDDILFEEEPFQRPQKSSPIEILRKENQESVNQQGDLIQKSSQEFLKKPFQSSKDAIKKPLTNNGLKEGFAPQKMSRKTTQNKLGYLYQKYTPQELLVILPAILFRKTSR